MRTERHEKLIVALRILEYSQDQFESRGYIIPRSVWHTAMW